MEKCFDFFFCEEQNCVRRDIHDKQCWEIEGTSCYDHSKFIDNLRELMEGKMDFCLKCDYYKIYK